MSERSDAPDVIYRFLLYGFSYGKDTLHMLQEPAVFHAFEVSRQVTNEAHSFREFIRFANISSGFPILVSHISPKANVLTLVCLLYTSLRMSVHGIFSTAPAPFLFAIPLKV